MSFRPQQGLTIMNWNILSLEQIRKERCFRPQQGLLIMNCYLLTFTKPFMQKCCFRPQQGLLIMNYRCSQKKDTKEMTTKVSVPNRGYLLWIMFNMNSGYTGYSFRPQQGLLIMNNAMQITVNYDEKPDSFRPQQGLLIMNSL